MAIIAVIIDCAFDAKLTDELTKYLLENGFTVQKENESVVTTNDPKLTVDNIEWFLKKTDKIKDLQIIQSDSDTIILATKVMIEHFGLGRCSICGFVAFKDELFAHERAHGIGLM
ncbi:MAG: hypothetical protein HZA84_08690 [Thaumarchaeota archaeon]|nr:hypothetical protein [Nitrososphaerota archaeon]